MRKLSLLFVIMFFSAPSVVNAQLKNHAITIAPMGFVNKVKLKYEKTMGEKLSVGAFAMGYYGMFPGAQLHPFVRFYMTGNGAPKGLYMQGKASVGYHNFSEKGIEEWYGEELVGDIAFTGSITAGGGVSVGYQLMVGSDNQIPIDFAMGFRFSSYPFGPVKYIGNNIDSYDYDSFDDALTRAFWYSTGPGSFFDGNVAIGIAF